MSGTWEDPSIPMVYLQSTIRNSTLGKLISIIPKPELRGFFWGDALTKPPFKVTSAEVVIISQEPFM